MGGLSQLGCSKHMCTFHYLIFRNYLLRSTVSKQHSRTHSWVSDLVDGTAGRWESKTRQGVRIDTCLVNC